MQCMSAAPVLFNVCVIISDILHIALKSLSAINNIDAIMAVTVQVTIWYDW